MTDHDYTAPQREARGETMSETVKVYGASDDLIEVEGPAPVNDEFSGGAKPKFVGFSDGTVLRVVYGDGDSGFWRLSRVVEGAAKYEHRAATDEESDYSDVVTLTGGPFTRVKCAGTVKAASIGEHAKDPRYETLRAFAAWIADNYDEVEGPAFSDLVDDYLASLAEPADVLR